MSGSTTRCRRFVADRVLFALCVSFGFSLGLLAAIVLEALGIAR